MQAAASAAAPATAQPAENAGGVESASSPLIQGEGDPRRVNRGWPARPAATEQCWCVASRCRATALRVCITTHAVALSGSLTPCRQPTHPPTHVPPTARPAELLRRTEEKKAERAKERLDAYYQKNYGDYLSFQASD